jgi:trehalose-6-phosphatase
MDHVRLYRPSKEGASQDWRYNLIVKRMARILSLLQFTLFRGTPMIGDDQQTEATDAHIEAGLTTIDLRPTLEWKGNYKKAVEKGMESRPGSATEVDDDGNGGHANDSVSTISDDSDDAGGFGDKRSHSYKVKALTSSNSLFGLSACLNSDVRQDKDKGFLDLHLKLRVRF